MSNELLVGVAAVGLAVMAILFVRFMILDDPSAAILHRVGRFVHEADPDLRARLSLQELQRPAGSLHRRGDTEVGR
jgi:hypothetical protein